MGGYIPRKGIFHPSKKLDPGTGPLAPKELLVEVAVDGPQLHALRKEQVQSGLVKPDGSIILGKHKFIPGKPIRIKAGPELDSWMENGYLEASKTW